MHTVCNTVDKGVQKLAQKREKIRIKGYKKYVYLYKYMFNSNSII